MSTAPSESRQRFLNSLAKEMGRAGYCNNEACHEFLDRAYQEGEDAAERDTLERCAQLVAKIQPYHAMVPADMDEEHMYKVGFADALRAVVERIRGKE